MENLMRALAGRLKAAFATHAALSAEAELARLDGERRLALLRQAERLEAEGLAAQAEALRRFARSEGSDGCNGHEECLAASANGGNGTAEAAQQPVPALAAPPAKDAERKKK